MAMNRKNKLALTEELEKEKYRDTIESVRAHIENKNEYCNLNRYLNIQRKEREEDIRAQQEQENAAFREKCMIGENNLARELDRVKREEIKQMRLRQQLRENSHELRDLERKLKAAYINKELAAQIAQKEAERLNEKIQDKQSYEILKTAWVEESEYKKKIFQDELMKKRQYKQELQDQIILKEKSKRHLYEEYLREKKLIDDIVQRIHDEDERDTAEKMCKMKRTREEMDGFKAAQELWKRKKKNEIEEENRKIQQYLMGKAASIKAMGEEREKLEARKTEISENLAKQIYEERAKQQEREDIIQELLEEEQKEMLEKRHREDLEKQIRKRLETRGSLAKQMEEKQERLEQDSKEEARFRDAMLLKLAEDEKLEQLSAQKKRMKMLQLRRDVEQMIFDRRQKHAEELQLLMKMEEHEKMEMEQRKRFIEEERIRMLNDHVKNLIGYLPKGILKLEDLPHLGSDITEKVTPGLQLMS